MWKAVGCAVGAVGAGLAVVPTGDGEMYRGLVDTEKIQEPRGVMKAVGYAYLPMKSLDKVTYANEIPWERHAATTGVWVPLPTYTELVAPKKDDTRMVDAIFTTRESAVGILAPLDDYSNLELRSFRQ